MKVYRDLTAINLDSIEEIKNYCVYFIEAPMDNALEPKSGFVSSPSYYIGSGRTSKLLNKTYLGSVASETYKEEWSRLKKTKKEEFKVHILFMSNNRYECFDEEEIIQRKYDVVNNPDFVNLGYANQRFNMQGKKHKQATLEKFKFRKRPTIVYKKGYKRSKLVCKAISLFNRNRITVFDLSQNKYKRVIMNIEYNQYVVSGNYIHVGNLRSEESRNKTTISSSDRYHCYKLDDPSIKLFLKNNQPLPEGFIKGYSDCYLELQSKSQTGLQYFYNPITKEQTKAKECPEGYIPGRIDFGTNGNPFKTKIIGMDIRTKEKSSCYRNDIDSVYHIAYNSKNILKFGLYYSNQSSKINEILKEKGIQISTDALNSFKSGNLDAKQYRLGPLISDIGIEIISVLNYQYNKLHVWI